MNQKCFEYCSVNSYLRRTLICIYPILINLLAFVGILDNCYSQDTSNFRRIEITPIIGYEAFGGRDANDLFSNPELDNTIVFGINIDYYFRENWSIHTGIIYNKVGAVPYSLRIPIDVGVYVSAFGTISETALNLPIMANWHFGKRKNWFLAFGPSVDFVVGRERIYFPPNEEEAIVFPKAVIFGFGLEIGVKIPIWVGSIQIASYGYGGFNRFKYLGYPNGGEEVVIQKSLVSLGYNLIL